MATVGMFQFKRPPAEPENDRQGFYNRPPTPWYWTPRVTGKGDYQFDADGAQRYTRPRSGIDRFMLSPFMQMRAGGGASLQNIMTITMAINWGFVTNAAVGKDGSGPVMGTAFDPDSVGVAEYFDLPKTA